MPLDRYRSKRHFDSTSEPSGDESAPKRARGKRKSAKGASFVIQKHAATRLHYDFRLELDGVLVSWAVPKGPSLDPHDKRLAVHVEDHPLDYGGFEGTIPKGEYGAGTVIVWDRGTWEPLGDARAGLERGDLKFSLHGEKLEGTWALVRMKPRPGEKGDNWLLIKERDEYARPSGEFDVLAEKPESVLARHSDDPPPAAEKGSDPFPAPPDLQLATLVDDAPNGSGWLAELKYDGYRLAIALRDGRARAFTRSHADWSDRFAPLLRAAESLPVQSAVLDGEAVVFDEHGITRFELLQNAIKREPGRIAFAAFDLLYLNGHDIRDLPLRQRKELLGTLLDGQDPASPIRFAQDVAEGAGDFLRKACETGLEGAVFKRADGRYAAGRGREWLKVKCGEMQEFVIGGFTEGAGSRAALGSLLLGTYDKERLVYAGRAGSGLDQATVSSLRRTLDKLERATSPFAEPPRIGSHVVHWVTPRLVAEVSFREWTSQGLLRQPVFRGLREDKPAREVVREQAVADPPTAEKPGAATAASVLGVRISNPDKRLFPESTFTKLEFAQYYEAVAKLMLPHARNRFLTLLRCPAGRGGDCFYQRHPDAAVPKQVRVLAHSLKGTHEPEEWLYVDSADGLVALAQAGAAEIHSWLSHTDAPSRPDRIVFDLDPGPGVTWDDIRSAAQLVREECESLGFAPHLNSTGSKGLHVVLPLKPVWEFERIRPLAKAIVDRLVAAHPDTLIGKMAKAKRGGRIFLDYLRNAEGASAIVPYSTRYREGPSCAVPLGWDELTPELDITAMTPERVIRRVREGADPWRDIADAAVGVRVLSAAEKSLAG